MKLLLEKRNTIYGMCALWIVLFHIFRRIGMPYIPIVTNIVGIGNIGVDIFVFLSGLCLSLSAEKRKEFQLHVSERTRDFFGGLQATALFNYYKRRFKRILVPYFLICIPYYLWYAMFEKHGSIMRRGVIFVANLTSAAFWIKGTQTTWYVYGILIFYLLFPLLYMVIRRGSRLEIISLMAGLICFAIITAYAPILINSMIVWARLPIFTIGIIVGCKYKQDETMNNNSWIVFGNAAVFFTLFFLTSTSEISKSFTLPQIIRFLIYIPMTLSLLYILSKTGGKIQFLEWCGTVSLEIYLVHITLLHPIKYYGLMDSMGYWLYLILPALSILLAWIVQRIEHLIRIGM